MEFKDMKSVADLIANKEALIKRNKRGKITAAAVAAAGASAVSYTHLTLPTNREV